MVKEKLHPALSQVLGSLLLPALLGTLSGASFGPSRQIQPNTPQAIARSAAEKASSQATQGQTGAAPAGQKKVRKVRSSRRGAGLRRPTARTSAPAITGRRLVIIGRRDPFKLPPPPGRGGEQQIPEEARRGPLPPGTRGLVISQLKLQGVVRMELSNQMIAVVVPAYANRAYFLRENDAVFNGVVSKITPDSIYFKENFLDQYGRAQVREVVKRMGTASGEGR